MGLVKLSEPKTDSTWETDTSSEARLEYLRTLVLTHTLHIAYATSSARLQTIRGW